jgi:hypothetical protein
MALPSFVRTILPYLQQALIVALIFVAGLASQKLGRWFKLLTEQTRDRLVLQLMDHPYHKTKPKRQLDLTVRRNICSRWTLARTVQYVSCSDASNHVHTSIS